MKKEVFISIILFCLGSFVFSILYNGFSQPDSISLQKYDESSETGILTKNTEVLQAVTSIMNRANKLQGNFKFELTNEPGYKIQLNYKDKGKEILYIYENFDRDKTLLIGEDNYYKISKKETDKMLKLLIHK